MQQGEATNTLEIPIIKTKKPLTADNVLYLIKLMIIIYPLGEIHVDRQLHKVLRVRTTNTRVHRQLTYQLSHSRLISSINYSYISILLLF